MLDLEEFWTPKKKHPDNSAGDLFGMVKCPFQRLSDLQLGKVGNRTGKKSLKHITWERHIPMLKYFLILVLQEISTSHFVSRGPHYVICHKAGVAGMFGEATIQIRLHLKKDGMAIGREGTMI